MNIMVVTANSHENNRYTTYIICLFTFIRFLYLLYPWEMVHLINLNKAQGRIKKGGALWASARGPALSGDPADFLGLAVVYGAMFFGTEPHGFGRIYYICIGALRPHVLISNMN